MATEFVRPRGDATTVLDVTDRDGQDDALFPLSTENSWLTRDPDRRTVQFAPQIQTFLYKGTAATGGRMTFELGQNSAGDLIHMIGLQVELGHWIDPGVRAALEGGSLVYQDPTAAWTYANGIGRILIQSAEFEVDDTTIERVDFTAADIIFKLFPDLNNVVGFSRDGFGCTTQAELITPPSAPATPAAAASVPPSGMFDPRRPYTTDRGKIFCLIPFFFTRNPYRGAFPLLATTEGRARVHIQLAPFANIVRACSGQRTGCEATPLGQTFNFVQPDTSILTVTAPADPPVFGDIRLIVYSSLLGDEVRQPYLRKPFEVMYRELMSFPFTQPLKYAVTMTNSALDSVRVQLPIEANHPVEEILWVIRRKAAVINNEWINYSSYTETQLTANPNLIQQGPLVDASIYINGQAVVQQSGDWFRAQIARRHKGGAVGYNAYIYGYSFAMTPGAFTPSGTANLSRAQSVRLDLNVRVPPAVSVPAGFDPDISQTWEVHVYTFGINWLRFQNGLCSRMFTT